MSQILNLSTQEVALAGFELQSRVPQTNEHFPKSCQVFFKITAIDDNVVQINRTRRPLKTRQYVFHESLKCTWCNAQPKWHDVELVQLLVSNKR